MTPRHDFVLRALEPGVNFAALCRSYEISRKTGYKWLKRFRERGVRGLEELERGPAAGRSPLQCSPEMAVDVVTLRTRYPTWGARKLRAVLLRENADRESEVPSLRTIGRILTRAGLIQARRRRRRKTSPGKRPEVVVAAPNDLWTVDFKGWWRSLGGRKCEPLTVRDAYSRKVLAVRLVRSTSVEEVKAVFEELFRHYGMPLAIQSDNGPPFAVTTGVAGLTRLSAWWIALGIRFVRSRVGCPQDNGGHERMHRDMKAELQRNPAATQEAQQTACDVWRHEFNEHRPHAALGMKTPNSVYRRSPRVYPEERPVLEYPPEYQVRRVSACGTMRYHGFQRHVSNALAGYRVGVERLEDMRFRVWFGSVCIGVGELPWEANLRPPGADVVAV